MSIDELSTVPARVRKGNKGTGVASLLLAAGDCGIGGITTFSRRRLWRGTWGATRGDARIGDENTEGIAGTMFASHITMPLLKDLDESSEVFES